MHRIKEEEGKVSSRGKAPGADGDRELGVAKFLYDIAKLAFGAAVTASCFKNELTGIFASLLFAVMVAFTAFNLERKGNGGSK
jgi:hypothetical protein